MTEKEIKDLESQIAAGMEFVKSNLDIAAPIAITTYTDSVRLQYTPEDFLKLVNGQVACIETGPEGWLHITVPISGIVTMKTCMPEATDAIKTKYGVN
jgi:hypothetical protein